MYTFLQLKRAVEFAAGGTLDAGQTTARVTSGMIVNKAIDHVERLHNWSWLRTQTTLPLTSGQAYIVLPSGLNELLGVALTAASAQLSAGIKRVSPDVFLNIQAWTYPVQFIGYMLMGSVAASNTAEALKRLAISPTPSATTADAVRVMYTRSLHRFPTDDSLTTEDTYLPDLPPAFSEVLFNLCRAFAIETEDEQIGTAFSAANNTLALLIEQDKRTDEQADNSPQSVLINQLDNRLTPGTPGAFSYTWVPTVP